MKQRFLITLLCSCSLFLGHAPSVFAQHGDKMDEKNLNKKNLDETNRDKKNPGIKPQASSENGLGADYQAKLLAELRPVSKKLERWRGLAFKKEIVPEFVEEKDAPKKLAGWYESTKGRLVLVLGRSEAFSYGTLLHELHHALQDQRWDLSALEQIANTRDQQRAMQGIIEGEAMLAVSEIMNYDFEKHTKLPTEGDIKRDRFEKIFNYGVGLSFVRALREQGGWEEVDGLWKYLRRAQLQQQCALRDKGLNSAQCSVAASKKASPFGTAQLYHPERYPMLPAQLPAGPKLNGKLLKEDRLGEFELRWLIVQEEKARADVAEIAASYLGDSWRLVRADDGIEYEHWDIYFSDKEREKQFIKICNTACRKLGWQINEASAGIHLWRVFQKDKPQ